MYVVAGHSDKGLTLQYARLGVLAGRRNRGSRPRVLLARHRLTFYRPARVAILPIDCIRRQPRGEVRGLHGTRSRNHVARFGGRVGTCTTSNNRS